MSTPTIKLSQCMIVKNEEKYMEQALSWGRDIMFEQIVVDTGSADRTVEIAERMGAKVYNYIWEDDFSAAKNYAIGKASGDWIAFMDADEWMTPEDTAKVIPLLQQIHRDRSIDALLMQCVHLDEDGSIIGTSILHRLFRNDRKIRYRNRIHEELYREGKIGLRSKDVQRELAVLHAYGDGGVERQKAKGARNAQILQKELEADPKDALRIMYLGDAFSMAQEDEQALDTYRRILSEPGLNIPHEVVVQRAGLEVMARLLQRAGEGAPGESERFGASEPSGEPGTPSAVGLAASGENTAGQPLPAELRTEFFSVAEQLKQWGGDEHPDLYYLQGCLFAVEGDYAKAAELFETALARLETYKGMETVRLNTNLTMATCVIAKAALEVRGDLQKAVQYAVLTLRGSKYHADAIDILLKAFRCEWKEGTSVAPYVNFLGQLYDLGAGDAKDAAGGVPGGYGDAKDEVDCCSGYEEASDRGFLKAAAEKAGFGALAEALQDSRMAELR